MGKPKTVKRKPKQVESTVTNKKRTNKDASAEKSDKAIYFWQDPEKRALLRKYQQSRNLENSGTKATEGVSDAARSDNIFVRRLAAHKQVSQVIYRRQKRKA